MTTQGASTTRFLTSQTWSCCFASFGICDVHGACSAPAATSTPMQSRFGGMAGVDPFPPASNVARPLPIHGRWDKRSNRLTAVGMVCRRRR